MPKIGFKTPSKSAVDAVASMFAFAAMKARRVIFRRAR